MVKGFTRGQGNSRKFIPTRDIHRGLSKEQIKHGVEPPISAGNEMLQRKKQEMENEKIKGEIVDSIDIKFKFIANKPYFDGDDDYRDVYRVTVKRNGESISFTYGDSIANSEAGIKPTKDDLLETLTSDYYYTTEYYPTFEDFADEFGYESDSRKAHSIYKKALKNGNDLHKLFNDEDIEKLRNELGN